MKLVAKTIAYEHIRKKLMVGKLKPGDPVSELGLSKEMGISRSPVREAICQLQSEGFIRKMEGYGAFVPVLSVQEVREMFEVRAALESLAAERAAELIQPADIEKLQECCRTLRNLADEVRRRKLTSLDEEMTHRHVLADATFHLTIINISRNQLIRRVVGDLHIMSRSFVTNLERELSPLTSLADDYLRHSRLIRPLKNHDSKAAGECMRQHILGTLQETLQGHQQWLDGRARAKSMDYSMGIADEIRRLGETR